jgi:hypothetical protein
MPVTPPVLSARQRRIARWSVVPLAVVTSGILVSTASYAAFTASTENAANAWRAGSITLADDDSGSALFDASDLQPGSTDEQCITVTAGGSLPATVALHAEDAAATKDLDDHLQLVVESGTGGSAGSCVGFTREAEAFSGTLAGFVALHGDSASGVGSWTTPGGSATKTYRIGYTLAADAPDSTQGGTAGVSFVWEAQTS